MEFFEKAVAVRLKSRLDKYLVAGDDHVTVRQSSSEASSRAARWTIEHVDSNNHVIRLKSCYGRYLTATNTPHFFRMIGNKTIQSAPQNPKDLAIEWQPVRDGFQFKLKSSAGTYLKANGAMPPWRNTVTHGGSCTSSMINWILWDVEPVDVPEDDYLSTVSSFSSFSGELTGLEVGWPISVHSPSYSPRTPALTVKKKIPLFRLHCSIKLIKQTYLIEETGPPVMDLLSKAKVVRLRSHQGKFLHANNDQDSVSQDRNGTTKNTCWLVELVENTPENITIMRLKSCYNKYLTASNHPFLLGMTGKKVLQTVPRRLDSSVEWEPLQEGKQVKLKTRYGHFLRANGGLPPWRNSVTHDIPYRTATKDWIMWEIDIVDVVQPSPIPRLSLKMVPHSFSATSSESSTPSTSRSKSPTFSNQELSSSPLRREEGRVIYYRVISDEYGEKGGNVNAQAFCISFKGNGVDELTQMLEEETRLDNITVCTESPLDGKLYPLRLHLPPNNESIKVVVVPNSSKQLRLKG